MEQREVELLDEDLDDILTYASSEIGLPIDLTRDDLEDEGDLGLRMLYEHPEAILGRASWSDAA